MASSTFLRNEQPQEKYEDIGQTFSALGLDMEEVNILFACLCADDGVADSSPDSSNMRYRKSFAISLYMIKVYIHLFDLRKLASCFVSLSA